MIPLFPKTATFPYHGCIIPADRLGTRSPTDPVEQRELGLSDAVEIGRRIIREESEALSTLSKSVGDPFGTAVALMLACRDQVIVTGIGKSGLIARKAAATFSSTGTPALFMHPVEGVHGDLGVVSEGAVLLALSKSGQTAELVRFVGHFRRVGGSVIAMCEPGTSALAELADVVLTIPARPEAGPLALAPTTSTVMMLALCDAMAMALLDARGLTREQFARFHPDGSLGRRLLLRASDLMHGGREMPRVRGSAAFPELLLEITSKRLGMTCVVEDNEGLIGVVTDGDLRRLFLRCKNPGRLTARDAWRQSRRDPNEPPVECSTVLPTQLAVECLRSMRESQITVLVLSEDGSRPVGIIRLQDIVRAGIG